MTYCQSFALIDRQVFFFFFFRSWVPRKWESSTWHPGTSAAEKYSAIQKVRLSAKLGHGTPRLE